MPGFSYAHRVSYADCTIGNHVYYGRYLELLEAARGEFFRRLGTTFLAWQEQDVVFPVIECRLRYKAAARYDDTLAIEISPVAAEGARLSFRYRIHNQNGMLVLEGETGHACATAAGKARRLPEQLVAALEPYLAQHGLPPR